MQLTLFQLAADFDVVINCAGLASGRLTSDFRLYPIRGVLLQVRTHAVSAVLDFDSFRSIALHSQVAAPWQKHFVYAGSDQTFVVPSQETLFLGTVRESHNASLALSRDERDDIVRRCTLAVPTIRVRACIVVTSGD